MNDNARDLFLWLFSGAIRVDFWVPGYTCQAETRLN
jgi:hypothetical protein